MFVAEDKEFWRPKDAGEEMMALGGLLGKFPGRVDDGIDGAVELVLGRSKDGGKLTEGDRSDDEQVEIAGRAFLAAGDGSKDEGETDLIGEGEQSGANGAGAANGFTDDGTEFFVERGIGGGAEEHMAADERALEDACLNEALGFALDLSDGQPGALGDLPQVETFIGMGEQEAQERQPGGREEGCPESVAEHCTHIGYKCIEIEYGWKATAFSAYRRRKTSFALCGSVHVEDFAETHGDRGVVGVGVHDVFHVGPPFFDDGGVGEVGGVVVVGEFLDGEQVAGAFVEEDGIVGDACGAKFGGELGPDFVVALFVLGFVTGLELHDEGVAFHGGLLGGRTGT
jgi:hypothetical protein